MLQSNSLPPHLNRSVAKLGPYAKHGLIDLSNLGVSLLLAAGMKLVYDGLAG